MDTFDKNCHDSYVSCVNVSYYEGQMQELIGIFLEQNEHIQCLYELCLIQGWYEYTCIAFIPLNFSSFTSNRLQVHVFSGTTDTVLKRTGHTTGMYEDRKMAKGLHGHTSAA